MSKADLYVVSGKPILHSRSPELYNLWFEKNSISAHYSRLAVDSAKSAYALMKELGIKGMNITAPFKDSIVPLVVYPDPLVTTIDSTNVITNHRGQTRGYNTDYIAIEQIIQEHHIETPNKKCLVIGAGGAARAAVYALINVNADVTIINRTYEKANHASKIFGCKVSRIENLDSEISNSELIVYAIPGYSIEIKKELLRKDQIIIDANYKKTPLCSIAEIVGLKYISGFEWLVEQGKESFRIYTGITPKQIDFDFNNQIEKNNNIVLIGFMGSGKTEIGKQLAEYLNYKFIDIDKLIELREGSSINSIFEQKGEEYFREIESKVLLELSTLKKSVIATGGGVIESDKNITMLKKLGTVVWLYASPSICLSRINSKDRPLLKRKDRIDFAVKLFAQRKEKYFTASDLIVDSSKSIEEVAEIIFNEIKQTQRNIFVMPGIVNGSIIAPASKSMSIRALIAAFLSGNSILKNVSKCDDAITAKKIIECHGAEIIESDGSLQITNSHSVTEDNDLIKIDCGESALCLRLLSALAGVMPGNFILEATGSLSNRNIIDIGFSLEKMGLLCKTNNGGTPLRISGKFIPGDYTIDSSKSSQFLSGLLMALPLLNGDSQITVLNLVSSPYIDMTIVLLKAFGIQIQLEKNIIYIKGNQKYNSSEYNIEGDWSSAATLLTAGAIAGTVTISGLSMDSKQPDKSIIDVLEKVGAKVSIECSRITVEKNDLRAFDFDATDSPDLLPILAVLACNCTGTSRIKGTERLLYKESNRANALLEELSKLSANIRIENNYMIITGSQLRGSTVFSHNDHRIAMALAVSALNCDSPVSIQLVDCVSKSFTNFWNDIKKLGVKLYE